MKQLATIAFFYILTWVHFTHCQDRIDVLMKNFELHKNATLKEMAAFKQKQNETLEVLKVYGDLQQNQNDILEKLSGYGDLQQKQNDILAKLSGMQEKQEQVEGKLQEMQEKLQHVEINLQEFHHELEHMKGAVNSNQDSLQKMQKMLGSMENNLHSAVNNTQDSLQNISAKLEKLEGIHQETKGCLRRENLELFKNISSAGQQELESLLRQEISGVISLLETGGIDECSEGSHNCTDYEACADKLFKYQCSCLPGFARDGSLCEDVDECAQGKDDCSPWQHAGTTSGVTAAPATHLPREMGIPVPALLDLHKRVRIVKVRQIT
ncbi:uncharacterized protein LOC135199267 isoform X2 [Macrobrachium nipponense]|uniref:uncharacterized protein LOC135199267 isoform X2 n=1 Tax=Macrobrachium nipponense TaxID=159736 RepID=UPI0030C7F1C1